MAKDTPLDALTEELQRWGIVPEKIRTGRRMHPKIYFRAGGKPLLYTCSATPSDPRAVKNQLAGLRRILKASGAAEGA
jgi:hypothetical protein